MKQTYDIPSGCKAVTVEQNEKNIVISFEPDYQEGKWYYIGSLQKAFRCTEKQKTYMLSPISNDCYEITIAGLMLYKSVIEATTKQVEDTLGKAADAKGFKVGVKVRTVCGKYEYISKPNKPLLKDDFFYFYAAIYDNQKNEWATIIQPKKVTLTKEQIEAVVE